MSDELPPASVLRQLKAGERYSHQGCHFTVSKTMRLELNPQSESNEGGGERKFAPLCIWCNAPWSDENVLLEIGASEMWSSVGAEAYGSVKIVCHVCKRLMYEKEHGC